MQGIEKVATQMLSSAERALAVTSQNVANIRTPGFKSGAAFVEMVVGNNGNAVPQIQSHASLVQGSLTATGGAFDVAISGPGFFHVSDGESDYYTRKGQFRLLADGRVMGGEGLYLQNSSGSDLVLEDNNVEIAVDGTILREGVPIDRIALYWAQSDAMLNPINGTLFSLEDATVEQVADPVLHQGMLESSNVDLAGEMVEMMESIRFAEAAAQVMSSYDTLLGQSISTFGGQS